MKIFLFRTLDPFFNHSIMILLIQFSSTSPVNRWTYQCDEFDRCLRFAPFPSNSSTMSLAECKFTCRKDPLALVLLPRPRQIHVNYTNVVSVNVDKIEFGDERNTKVLQLLYLNFQEQIRWLKKKNQANWTEIETDNVLRVKFAQSYDTDISKLYSVIHLIYQ